MKKFRFIWILSLVPAIALAQQDASLPDAPSFVLAKAAAAAESTAAVNPNAPAAGAAESKAETRDRTEAEAQNEAQNEARLHHDPLAQANGAASMPWLASGAESYPRDREYAGQGARIDLDALLGRMNRPSNGYTIAVGPDGVPEPMQESYHWKGLLWESFAFFGVENSQRLLADSYFRDLTADRPFWHDYIASAGQWNWRRWDDGDDFLVAYVAHPLQGSVTEFIEIQNSPRTRDYRINDGEVYWKSRLLSSLWATIYSFDQKLGPLGETALGNEGGYNYVVGCAYPCPAYNANPSQFKVTNNTGWVKLMSTPVVGTVWTVMEDAIDHLISDRVQGDRLHAIFPKLLRGSLNPSRTMANFLRWRVPWYRDWQHGSYTVYLTPTTHFLPGDDEVILAAPKYEFFPHFNWISLPVNTASCSPCRQKTGGYGFGFSRRIATYADLDSDLNYQPAASPLPSDRAGGNILTATFGLRSGYTGKYYALKAFLRPGFLSYDRAYETSPSTTSPTPPIGRITHFSVALGVEGDVYINRYLGFRAVVGNQPVRYREAYTDPPGIGTYPYLNWLSKQYFLTNENWTYQAGTVLRF
jgi:hypothetical protein